MEVTSGMQTELSSATLNMYNLSLLRVSKTIIEGITNATGITDNTTAIILESANFDSNNIRRTSDTVGVRTDSSARFEKSLDPNLCHLALARAVELILEISAGAKITTAVQEFSDFHLATGPIGVAKDIFEKKIGAKV